MTIIWKPTSELPQEEFQAIAKMKDGRILFGAFVFLKDGLIFQTFGLGGYKQETIEEWVSTTDFFN